MQLQFLAPVEFLFKSSWTVAVFDPGGIIIFWFTVFPSRCWSCLHLYQEWNIQPLWMVEGLEQYTSWKLRVPDCVFFVRMNTDMCIYTYTYTYTYTDTYTYTYTHIHTHTNTCTYTWACTCVSLCFCCVVPCHVVCLAWLVGCGVVWCGVVVVLSWCRCLGPSCFV